MRAVTYSEKTRGAVVTLAPGVAISSTDWKTVSSMSEVMASVFGTADDAMIVKFVPAVASDRRSRRRLAATVTVVPKSTST